MNWLRRKLVNWIDDIYFMSVKNRSTQFRDDMFESFTSGRTYQILSEEGLSETETFNKWFKENYL